MMDPEDIDHPEEVPFEYDQISEYIYVGTNKCCQKHFREELLSKGVKADISMEKERLDSPEGVDFFLWLPVIDMTAPKQDQLLIGAKAIKNFVDNNIKTYVHCKRGHGRSPTIVAAYLILEGKAADKAMEEMKSKRKGMHLVDEQIEALKEFEKKVNTKI